MFQKLKTNIFPSQVQKNLSRTNINKTHTLINHINLKLLIRLINKPKQNKQLIQYLTRGIHSSSNTLKIKCYIVIHASLRYCHSQELVNIIVNQQVKIMDIKDSDKQVDFNVYVSNNIVNYYLIYLKKICMNYQSYQYIKKYTNFKQVPSKYNNYNNNKNMSLPNINSYNLNNNNTNDDNILQHEQNIAIVTNGFKILNLSNYLLQSQQLFNKMGRYHIQCQQFISLFVQILQDLNLFNKYIKLSIQTIIVKNNNNNNKTFVENCLKFLRIDRLSDYKTMENNQYKYKQGNKILYNFKKDKNMTYSTLMQSIQMIPQQAVKIAIDNHKKNQGQQLKHQFLYINQSQKVSDRLYQYYHNRYYYKILENIVVFPTFLTVQNIQYTRLKNKTKKVDKNLVRLIKKSKYDRENNVSYETQQNNSSNIQDQINLEKSNYTQSSYVNGQFVSTRYNVIIQKGVENLDQY